MHKGRLEAFSDGVLAIIITIMILEIKAPHSENIQALQPLIPIFISYILSFVYIGIYWNNHHHMMYAVKQVDGKVLWANIHLLFWLSLVPFATSWMGENYFNTWPVVLYGSILLMAGIAYYILSNILIKVQGNDSTLAQAVGKDIKGRLSILIYVMAIGLAFINPLISLALYAIVAIIWFIPDRRIEKKITNEKPFK